MPQILSVVKVFGERKFLRGERTLFFAKATYCVFKKGFSPHNTLKKSICPQKNKKIVARIR